MAGAGGSVGGSAAGASVVGGVGGASGGSGSGTAGGGAGAGGSAGAADAGPAVDRSDPQLHHLTFTAKDAEPAATLILNQQNALLDTRVEPVGRLVVYLHGAGAPSNCGNNGLAELVVGWGYHWFSPCYSSDYGVAGCGDDIGGCRREAFEGVDHHDFISVSRPDSIEGRVVAALKYLRDQNPQGDWGYFLEGDEPRWAKIVISGQSHGASSAGLIGMYRAVSRVVMLAGPLDSGQAWLEQTPLSPIQSYFAFSHTADDQHPGHLEAFATLGMPGAPTSVDGAQPPYGQSHRLISSRATNNGHNAVTDANIDDYHPVFEYLYR